MTNLEPGNLVSQSFPSVLDSTFVAKLRPGRRVDVREGHIVWSFEVAPAGAEGWALLRPISYGRALVVGAPNEEQIRKYHAALKVDEAGEACLGVCVGSALESLVNEAWSAELPDEISRELMCSGSYGAR